MLQATEFSAQDRLSALTRVSDLMAELLLAVQASDVSDASRRKVSPLLSDGNEIAAVLSIEGAEDALDLQFMERVDCWVSHAERLSGALQTATA